MIDLLASEPHYMAHAGPIWDALPDDVRGARFPRQRVSSAVLVPSGRDLMRAERMGYRQIALMEHGIGQSYGNGSIGYPGGNGRGNVSLFLSPNETAAGMDRAMYPDARVEVIGDPRLDTLPKREPGPVTVALSFHWSAIVWKPFDLSAIKHYRAALAPLARAFNVIGHAHPRATRSLEPLYRRAGIEFVRDFDDVCRRADVYVCDNSSTIYEFASTGLPVILLNAPWYRRDMELGLRFWEAAGVGENVDESASLPPAVERALAPTGARLDRSEDALDIAYGYRTGAAERGAAAITDWLADIEPKTVSYSVVAA